MFKVETWIRVEWDQPEDWDTGDFSGEIFHFQLNGVDLRADVDGSTMGGGFTAYEPADINTAPHVVAYFAVTYQTYAASFALSPFLIPRPPGFALINILRTNIGPIVWHMRDGSTVAGNWIASVQAGDITTTISGPLF